MTTTADDPTEGTGPDPSAAEPATAAPKRFALDDFAAEHAQQRRSPRDLPRLLRSAVMLVYRTAPRLLGFTTALSIAGAALAAAQVLIGKYALEALIKVDHGQASVTSAMVPFVLMAGLAAISGAISIITGQLERLLGEQVQRATPRDLVGECTGVDLEAFEDPRFFDQLQRVMTNAIMRPVMVAQAVISFFRGAAGAIGLTVALLALAPLLIPLLLLIAIPLSVTSRRGSRLEFAFSIEQSPALRKRYYLQDIMTGRPGAKEVRAFGLGGVLIGQWDGLWDAYMLSLRRLIGRRMRLALLGRIGSALLSLGALAVLLTLVKNHQISLASAGAAGLALLMLSARIEAMANGGGSLYESGLFLSDLDNFLKLEAEYRDSHGTEVAPPSFSELRTDGLSFSYPGANVQAVQGVDISIKQGEIVALVGENGSGKTTLAKLLADLFQPTGGRILWDGQDVATMSPESVRDAVAVIFQDFLMYAMPAAQNIGVGRPDAMGDLPAIIEASKQAGAHEFLSRLPNGYHNYLSKLFEDGQDLSLGQWQRIALARAFYRDAPFVILDEPSSALDPRAEHELFSRIRSMLGGRTVLFISHRFSTVRSADRIYVMKEGRIVEHGNHVELMEQHGLYAELFSLQAEAYLAGQPV